MYKDYVKVEKDFNKKSDEQAILLRNARDELMEEQIKTKNLQQVLQTLNLKPNSIESRIVELTKQNSLLDVNLLRLTRKY